MSDTSVPTTPTPKIGQSHRQDDDLPPTVRGPSQSDDPKLSSPLPPSSSDLTPPPSSQIPKHAPAKMQYDSFDAAKSSLASPPPTTKISSSAFPVPTSDQIARLSENELRELLDRLLPELTEARVSVAHHRLQLNLLEIEMSEGAMRATVEQNLSRAEILKLQDSPRACMNNFGPMSPDQQSSLSSMQKSLQLALRNYSVVDAHNVTLERRLRNAKKVIERQGEQTQELAEENRLLKQRIKENREHLKAMFASGAISVSGTPRTEFGTVEEKATRLFGSIDSAQTPISGVRGPDPFDALLAAGQAMNGEANSVPTTPTRTRPTKINPSHTRGSHSMSSLPTAPYHGSGLVAANTVVMAPMSRGHSNNSIGFPRSTTQYMYAEGNRRQTDRDSTISVSDHDEEAYTEDDVPVSHAGQKAISMLRSTPKLIDDSTSQQRYLTQSKIIGQVKKNGGEVLGKRVANKEGLGEEARGSKRARLGNLRGEGIGLGIGDGTSPRS